MEKRMKIKSDTDRLIIHSAKPLSYRDGRVVRCILSDDAYKEICDLHDQTGIAISKLLRLLTEYALPRVEVIE